MACIHKFLTANSAKNSKIHVNQLVSATVNLRTVANSCEQFGHAGV
jgi:hypothetical protein